LTTFSPESIVLDPFLGSGTTVVAAKRLGRNYMGIEINSEYIAIAKQRLGEVEEVTNEVPEPVS
jgi:DNA modification methylase